MSLMVFDGSLMNGWLSSSAASAGRIALTAVADKPAARALRGDMAAIARDALVEALAHDGDGFGEIFFGRHDVTAYA